jgi:hypothetical protein
MPSQSLAPFSVPTSLAGLLPAGISAGTVVIWVLAAVFIFWALYTLVAIYHWLQYSHGSWLTFPAIALHLFVSIALMIYALTGTRLV